MKNLLNEKIALAFGGDHPRTSARKEEFTQQIIGPIVETMITDVLSLPRTPETSHLIDTLPIRLPIQIREVAQSTIVPLMTIADEIHLLSPHSQIVDQLESYSRQSKIQEEDFRVLSSVIHSEHRFAIEWKDRYVPIIIYSIATIAWLQSLINSLILSRLCIFIAKLVAAIYKSI